MLLNLIKAIQAATNISPAPFGTDNVDGNCIVYTSYPTGDDGAVCQMRLELRLITHTMEDAERLRKKILGALIAEGDNSKVDGIKACVLNGGGQLKDWGTDTIHTLLYFDIIVRSEI